MSVVKKCLSTVEPKLPVPPVITSVFPLKASVICIVCSSPFPQPLADRYLSALFEGLWVIDTFMNI